VKKNKINVFVENLFKSKINLGISFVIIVLLGYLIFYN